MPKKPEDGLSAVLQTGIEAASGHSLDGVQVHRSASSPAMLEAQAFAAGAEIHLSTGQERHLPHEAWHLVQQRQGRVRPTRQMPSPTIEGSTDLEAAADAMGAAAAGASAAPPESGQ